MLSISTCFTLAVEIIDSYQWLPSPGTVVITVYSTKIGSVSVTT